MGIFFKETVFLKTDSDLEKELVELEQLRSNVKDQDKLDKYIKTLRAGINGEKTIEYELKNARIGMFVLHDINLQYDDLNSQIDYVIVTPVHCYLVECKNMIGDITVDNKGQFVRKLPWGSKESIYSPYTQANRHVDVLKKIRDRNNGAIAKALSAFTKDDYYRPLVVVSNSNGILNTKYATKELKSKIVRADALIDYLKKDIEECGLINQNSKAEMEKVAISILNQNVEKQNNNWVDRFELKEEPKREPSTNNAQLREKLLNYRREESKKRNYPAYYIFNNDQLEKIIETKPSTKEKLGKILEPVKVKIYGEDIIEIVNSQK